MTKMEPNLSVARNLKIAVFHLGSGMADVLTTGVWNRIMISDLGFQATPIGLLISLRYFLAPLGIWAGRISDRRTILGLRRLFWVWLGRGLMVLSTIMLGYITSQLALVPGTASAGQWVMLAVSLLLFSFGSALSGSTFLALIYDRSAEHQRGRAVGLVWTFLLLGFTVGGIVFGVLLPSNEGATAGELSFTPDSILTLFLVAASMFFTFWFVSLIGEEKRGAPFKQSEGEQRSFRQDISLVWKNKTMRFFMFFLVMSMFFAFSQDLVLEPFAGDVFGLDASVTNRFAAYWGSTAIAGTLLFLWLSRRVAWLNNTTMSVLGVIFLIIAFGLLTLSSVLVVPQMMTPMLLLLGIGLGIWNVGTLGLMMDMSPSANAGTFLGFWTLVVTLGRGSGVAAGGIVRDIALAITGSPEMAYAAVFFAGTVGLLVALYCLSKVNVPAFKKRNQVQELNNNQKTATIFAGAMD
jgi:BCD family chlorophyll transporter-like MFS transporter